MKESVSEEGAIKEGELETLNSSSIDAERKHDSLGTTADLDPPNGKKPNSPKSRFDKKKIGLAIAFIAILVGSVLGWRWWQFLQTHVSTDNAQIDGHLSPISAKISANVKQVLVKNGDYVKVGQPLVMLDDPDLDLKVRQAQAKLAAAQAQRQGAKDTVVVTSQTNATQLQQALAKLAASQSSVKAAQANLNQAEAKVVAAQAQRQGARDTVSLTGQTNTTQQQQALARLAASQSSVKAAQASLNQAEAKVAAAQAQSQGARNTVSLTSQTNTTQQQQALARLAASQSSVKAARANLNQAEAAIAANRAKITQAQIDIEQKKADFSRYSNLYQQGAVSAQKFEAVRAAYENAQANLVSVNQLVAQSVAEKSSAQAQIEKALADVVTAKGQLAEAQANRGNVTVQKDQQLIAQAQVVQAFAERTNAQAQLEKALADVATARGQVAETQANRGNVTVQEDRQLISQAQVAQALAERNSAQAQLEKALADVATARGQVAETQANRGNVTVQQDQQSLAQAQVTQTLAELALARQQQDYATIKAPVSGYIGELNAQVGQKVQVGQSLLAVVPLQTDFVDVKANFKETALGKLQIGQKAEVKVDAYPNRTFTATVAGISPATGASFALIPPDNATGNFNKVVQWVPVRLKFDPETDREGKLRPGLSVSVTVDTTFSK